MTYVIGDVHGEFEMLVELIDKFPSGARVVFVGDLIDRGKDSKKVIDYIRKNKFECVMGNHEYMMFKVVDHILSQNKYDVHWSSYNWFYYGGDITLKSYGIDPNSSQNELTKSQIQTLKDDMEYFRNLPLFLELGITKNSMPVVVSHAFVGDHWDRRDERALMEKIALWNIEQPYKTPKIFNVFGHTPHDDVVITNSYVDVDTGCGFGKKLSAYCIETDEVISVDKKYK